MNYVNPKSFAIFDRAQCQAMIKAPLPPELRRHMVVSLFKTCLLYARRCEGAAIVPMEMGEDKFQPLPGLGG